MKKISLCILLISLSLSAIGCATKPDTATLYENAIIDAMYAEKSEIKPLVTLDTDNELTTWNEDDSKVLLITWNSYPDSYPAGEDVILSYGPVWTFTDKEIISWYGKNKKSMDDCQLRLNQLIGLQPTDANTHFTAFWVSPEDVIRPAYNTDITSNDIELSTSEMDDSYKTWFNDNIIGSYYSDYLYPWTRLGYTYDWADNDTEYGLTEFLVKENATVTVEYTMTTQDFITYMNE